MSAKNKFLLIVLAIIAIAFFTNPKPEIHKLAFKTKCSAFLESKIGSKIPKNDDLYSVIGKKLGAILGNTVMDEAINEYVTVENYGLFSLTKFTWNGKAETIGLGVFSNVFISNEFEKKINEKMADFDLK